MQGEHEKLIESVNRISEMNSNHLAKFVDAKAKTYDKKKPNTKILNPVLA